MIYDLLPIMNMILAVGSLILIPVTAVLFFDYFANQGRWFGARLKPWLWFLIMATTIGGMLVSLLYSEYFLYVPCSLCWLQRMALWPQVLLVLIAYQKKDTVYFPLYGLSLSIAGLVVAVYQYIHQVLPASARAGFTPCLVDGTGADCAEKVIDMFGFVTFPLVAAVGFAFLIVLYLYLLRTNK